MKKGILLITLIISLLFASYLFAGGGYNEHVVSAPVNLQDKVALQRGARLFVNYCYGCHSLKYLRYERLVEDLRLTGEIVRNNLMFTEGKLGDQMRVAMPIESAKQWFGTPVPDLTLEAKLRGSDWLYSYLIGFYVDPKRPWGYNNRVFPDVGMPHVLEGLEKDLGEEAFRVAMGDLTNFLTYAADPVRLKRERIGTYVLVFLVIFMIPVYFLNKEYWKNIN